METIQTTQPTKNTENPNISLYWDSWKKHLQTLQSDKQGIIVIDINHTPRSELEELYEIIEQTTNNTVVDINFDFSNLNDYDFIITNNNFSVHNIPEPLKLKYEKTGFDKFC